MKRAIAALLLSGTLFAQQGVVVKRLGAPDVKIEPAIWVGDMLYVCGVMGTPDEPGTPPVFHQNTEQQTLGAFRNIEKVLKEQGLGLGDIVQMQVFLAPDPKTGVMDLDGMNRAYQSRFGTKEQPNKPVRATVQVSRLVVPTGLIEVMVVAARPKK